jgi:hypothetical protein
MSMTEEELAEIDYEAAKAAIAERFPDGIEMADVRDLLRKLAALKNEYAGVPVPIEGYRLVVEPRYPYNLEKINDSTSPVPERATTTEDPKPEKFQRNRWYSYSRGGWVTIYQRGSTLPGDAWKLENLEIAGSNLARRFGEEWPGAITTPDGKRIRLVVKDPKIEFVFEPGLMPAARLSFLIGTMGVFDAWDMEAEEMAMEKLHELINDRMYDMYRMTGAFMEQSERSRVTYLFRRSRPTLALSATDLSAEDKPMACLAALCMHPIGYYERTWAGVMCPTDDVIAHLLLMRGDERKFWAQSNQHSLHMVEAGI